MTKLITESNPNFCDSHVTLGDHEYYFKVIKGNGCLFSIYRNGVLRDEISFEKQDIKALYMLLTTKL